MPASLVRPRPRPSPRAIRWARLLGFLGLPRLSGFLLGRFTVPTEQLSASGERPPLFLPGRGLVRRQQRERALAVRSVASPLKLGRVGRRTWVPTAAATPSTSLRPIARGALVCSAVLRLTREPPLVGSTPRLSPRAMAEPRRSCATGLAARPLPLVVQPSVQEPVRAPTSRAGCRQETRGVTSPSPVTGRSPEWTRCLPTPAMAISSPTGRALILLAALPTPVKSLLRLRFLSPPAYYRLLKSFDWLRLTAWAD